MAKYFILHFVTATLDDEFDIVESDADTISSDENSENSEIDKFDTVKDISEKAKGQDISERNSAAFNFQRKSLIALA